MSSFTLTWAHFSDLVSVGNFASKDYDRPILTGTHLRVNSKTVKATATDSYRLAIIERDLDSSDLTEEMEYLIPAKNLLRIAKELKPNPKVRQHTALVTLSFENEAVTINTTGDRFTVELLGGQYPQIDQLVPTARGISECDSIAFNPSFLGDFPKVAPFNVPSTTNSIRMVTLTDPNSPVMWESRDGRTKLLLMPVRVN